MNKINIFLVLSFITLVFSCANSHVKKQVLKNIDTDIWYIEYGEDTIFMGKDERQAIWKKNGNYYETMCEDEKKRFDCLFLSNSIDTAFEIPWPSSLKTVNYRVWRQIERNRDGSFSTWDLYIIDDSLFNEAKKHEKLIDGIWLDKGLLCMYRIDYDSLYRIKRISNRPFNTYE